MILMIVFLLSLNVNLNITIRKFSAPHKKNPVSSTGLKISAQILFLCKRFVADFVC